MMQYLDIGPSGDTTLKPSRYENKIKLNMIKDHFDPRKYIKARSSLHFS
jgi:hypothetical protein